MGERGGCEQFLPTMEYNDAGQHEVLVVLAGIAGSGGGTRTTTGR